MVFFPKRMLKQKMFLLILILSGFFLPAEAQMYEVSYKSLPSKVFTGSEPIKICILELVGARQKLYEGLIQDNDIKNKFLVYPTNVLIENKSSLGNNLDPEDKDFLKSLNQILGIEYLLHWVSLSDSGDTYVLTVYSTQNYQKLFDKKFYSSINSSPVLDVKKLLLENEEPVYKISAGELQVISKPEGADFKLFKDSALIKEWSGTVKQKLQAGPYSLVSVKDGFKKDVRTIMVSGNKTTVVNVEMEQDLSMLPAINSVSDLISSIHPELQGNQLKIGYNLGTGSGDKYNIELTLVNKNTQSSQKINRLSGDVEGVKPGSNKTIIWSFRDELGTILGLQNYEIKMSAQKAGGIAWYMYAGGGALLVGGAAALLLKGSSTNTPGQTTRTKIGSPPPRPN
jgi:hypothetical protein